MENVFFNFNFFIIIIIDRNDSRLLFVGCQEVKDRQGLSMATIKPPWQCLPSLLREIERILEGGEWAKNIWDSGSFWMLIGQMLQLIASLMHNILLRIRVESSSYQTMLTGSWQMTHLYFQQAKYIFIFQNHNLYLSTDFWVKG